MYKVNHLERNETEVDSLKKDNKECVKNSKLILDKQ